MFSFAHFLEPSEISILFHMWLSIHKKPNRNIYLYFYIVKLKIISNVYCLEISLKFYINHVEIYVNNWKLLLFSFFIFLPLFRISTKLTLLVLFSMLYWKITVQWKNDWDRPLNFQCSSRKSSIHQIVSYHDNKMEDRRFDFNCRHVPSVVGPVSCSLSGIYIFLRIHILWIVKQKVPTILLTKNMQLSVSKTKINPTILIICYFQTISSKFWYLFDFFNASTNFSMEDKINKTNTTLTKNDFYVLYKILEVRIGHF